MVNSTPHHYLLIYSQADVKLETKLWALAKELGQQVKTMLDNQAHFIFSEAKVLFETGTNTQVFI